MSDPSIPDYKRSQTSWIHYLAALPIPIIIVIILILNFSNITVVWSPYPVIPFLNIIFLSIIMLFVSILAARSYLEGRSIPILLLGCGTLALGLGSFLAGFELLGNNINSTISIYNTSACLSGACNLASALFSFKKKTTKARDVFTYLFFGYVSILVIIAALILLIQNNLWPIHFIQGSGATSFGLEIIYITIAFFAISSIILLLNKDRNNFRYWYGLGLGLIAVGLMGVSIQLKMGDPLNWVGRISQYLGAIYILIAVFSTIRRTGIWMLPVEKALLKSEERYKNIIDNLQDAYFMSDKDGRVVITSPSAARMYGYDSPQEIIGLHALSMYKNPEDRDYVIGQLNEHGKLSNFEVEAVRKNGSTFWVSQNAQYYYDDEGQIKGTEAFIRDIDQHKKAEEELKVSEEKYRSLYDSMNEGVAIHQVLYDKEGNPVDYLIKDVNNAYEEILGFNKEEVIGRRASQIYGIHEPPYLDIYAEVAQTGNPKNFETYFKSMDKNFQISVFSPKKEEFATVFEDMSERKKLEEDLRKSHNELELKVQERTEELEEAINELKRSNQELQSFAYITSHDLQEPLRTMGNYAGLLKRRYEGRLDDDADDFLEFMASGAARMKDMVQGLLDYSRVGTHGGVFSEFSTEDALKNALINLRSAIDDCNAEVTHESLPHIIADEGQITRVFQNLIGNALKFHSEGVKPEIHISAKKEDNEYVFSVSDNGIGLEDQYSDRIFEVFKRLHAIGKYEGAGIGLAIVKRIIDRHGGNIWVESEYGAGSTFYFTLPILNGE